MSQAAWLRRTLLKALKQFLKTESFWEWLKGSQSWVRDSWGISKLSCNAYKRKYIFILIYLIRLLRFCGSTWSLFLVHPRLQHKDLLSPLSANISGSSIWSTIMIKIIPIFHNTKYNIVAYNTKTVKLKQVAGKITHDCYSSCTEQICASWTWRWIQIS